MTSFEERLDEIYFKHFSGVRKPMDIVAGKEAIIRAVEELIGEDDHYNDMCEQCSNWDEGRNKLRDELKAKLRSNDE